MKYQIDQSGKIEQTNKITVIAFSNDCHGSIMLRAKDKRILQSIYQKAGKPRVFAIQVFSALLYLLLEKSKIKRGTIVIDKEYPGHEDLIKSYLVQLVKKRNKLNLIADNIRFELVGKTSKVHKVAHTNFKRKRTDFKVESEDVLGLVLIYEK